MFYIFIHYKSFEFTQKELFYIFTKFISASMNFGRFQNHLNISN
jgi:hypothetical protein